MPDHHGAPSPAAELSDLRVRYRRDSPTVLSIDRLALERGGRISVIGSSGSGKTTLLRVLNGYVTPTEGSLSILGEPMTSGKARDRALRRRVGFVFQNFHLIERATVFQNVLWGRLGHAHPLLSLMGRFTKADRRRAVQAIREVDLGPQLEQRADTLSTGQQQRVAVARVLAQDAELILADEPMSNLDPALAEDVLGLLGKVSRRHGATLLMSVHQPHLARKFSDRILALSGGRVVHDGPPESVTGAVETKIYGRPTEAIAIEGEP